MERLPRTDTANSLGGLVPKKRVRVSLSCPVTLSTSVLSSTPFSSPATTMEIISHSNNHSNSSLRL